MERDRMRGEIAHLSNLREENIAAMERDKASIQELIDQKKVLGVECTKFLEQNADVLGKWNQAAIDLGVARSDLKEALKTLQDSNEQLRSALGYIKVLQKGIEDLRSQHPVEEHVDGTVE